MKPKYPDDGGLKEQVRPFENSFSGFGMLTRHFGIRHIEPDPLSRGDQFQITRIPHLFYKAHNITSNAGHVRLFADRPGKGWCIYSYANQAPGWAFHRRWNFGLFCVHHVEHDKKATDPAGWNITWASLKFVKSYRGFTMTWRLADTFKCKGGINLFEYYNRKAKEERP